MVNRQFFMFGSFTDASAYIVSLDQLDTPKHSYAYAAEHGIARAKHLLARLGDAPHVINHCILVAGSKGKGSTVAMLSAVLSAAGYTVGAFTGPHLHTPLERFAIYPAQGDGAVEMPEIEFIALAEQVRQIVELWDAPEVGEPTRFESYAAMAYRWFEQRHVDIAIMEMGIGGRLDAVNLAEPLVSIITNISLEHTQMLGNTLAQIAREKAGILRQHGTGVIAHQSAEAAQAIRDMGMPLRFADEAVTLTSVSANIDVENSGQWFKWFNATGFEGNLFLPLLGAHQLQNAAAVLTAVQVLRERGWTIAPEAVRSGLARVRWPGRFEILWRRPYIVVDGAHTPYSMEWLCQALTRYFPGRPIHFILSMLRDKDARSMLATAGAIAATLTLTQTHVARSLQTDQLLQLAGQLDLSVPLHPTLDLPAALAHVVSLVQMDDVICVTGSLHLVAEARQALDAAEA